MSYNSISLEALGQRSPRYVEETSEVERNTRCSFETTDNEISLQESLTTSIDNTNPLIEKGRIIINRWDLWLYFVFYIIIILFGFLFLVNINNSAFYQRMNYPNWAPSVWILMCIWAFTFIMSLGGLFILLSHTLLAFFMLMLLLNVVILMTVIIIMWFAGLIILSCVFLILGIIYAIFVSVIMSRYTVLGACLQIPYILFLILLLVICFQLSYDNSDMTIPIGRQIYNRISR